jgi:hypothetical protein
VKQASVGDLRGNRPNRNGHLDSHLAESRRRWWEKAAPTQRVGSVIADPASVVVVTDAAHCKAHPRRPLEERKLRILVPQHRQGRDPSSSKFIDGEPPGHSNFEQWDFVLCGMSMAVDTEFDSVNGAEPPH